MATFEGFHIVHPEGGVINDYLTNAYHGFKAELWPPSAEAILRFKPGIMLKMVPVSTSPRNVVGFHAQNYGKDFFHRVHIVPKNISLGNMLSVQKRNVEIWNAHLTSQFLATITRKGTEGISESMQSAIEYNPLQSRVYELSVSTNGPPIIDAEYIFNFPGVQPTLAIEGRRVVVWPYMPQTRHRETLEWLTDIIPSYNREQRLALRTAPRQSLGYVFQLDAHQFSRAKAMATQWAHRVYGIPVWAELTRVGPMPLGSTVIPVDTSFADYRVGGIVLLWDSDLHFEAAECLGISPNSISLKRPLEKLYSNAYVAPIRFALTLNGMAFKRGASDIVEADATFLVTENIDLGSANLIGFPQYRGKDVLTDPTVLIGELSERLSRVTDLFDNGSGAIVQEVRNSWVNSAKTLTFDALNREHSWEVRQWLHSKRGKQKAFWLPSWTPDLVLVRNADQGDIVLIVRPIGYPLYYSMKDAAIVLTNGSILFVRFLSGDNDPQGNERLTLSETLPRAIAISEVRMICFMSHVRANSDRVDIRHGNAGRANMSIPLLETPE